MGKVFCCCAIMEVIFVDLLLLMVEVIQLLLGLKINRMFAGYMNPIRPHTRTHKKKQVFDSLMGFQPFNSTLSHPHNPNGFSTKDSCSILFSCSPLSLIYTTIGPSEGAFSVLHVTFLDLIIGMVMNDLMLIFSNKEKQHECNDSNGHQRNGNCI